MDYESLIGQTVQTVADCRLITVNGEELYFDPPPMVRLIGYDHSLRLFICDMQTGDEHDGKHVRMSSHAVEWQLGLNG